LTGAKFVSANQRMISLLRPAAWPLEAHNSRRDAVVYGGRYRQAVIAEASYQGQNMANDVRQWIAKLNSLRCGPVEIGYFSLEKWFAL
jgi:hypothetical protein